MPDPPTPGPPLSQPPRLARELVLHPDALETRSFASRRQVSIAVAFSSSRRSSFDHAIGFVPSLILHGSVLMRPLPLPRLVGCVHLRTRRNLRHSDIPPKPARLGGRRRISLDHRHKRPWPVSAPAPVPQSLAPALRSPQGSRHAPGNPPVRHRVGLLNAGLPLARCRR
jgi:hypothetical protein